MQNLSTPLWWGGDIGPGDTGGRVTIVQRMLLCYPTGAMDNSTVAAVRGFQVALGIEPSGWVDAETAAALGPRASDEVLPEWFKGAPLHPGDPGYEVATSVVGGPDAVRRLQGNHGLPPTGIVDEATARLLAGLAV